MWIFKKENSSISACSIQQPISSSTERHSQKGFDFLIQVYLFYSLYDDRFYKTDKSMILQTWRIIKKNRTNNWINIVFQFNLTINKLAKFK